VGWEIRFGEVVGLDLIKLDYRSDRPHSYISPSIPHAQIPDQDAQEINKETKAVVADPDGYMVRYRLGWIDGWVYGRCDVDRHTHA
jgi:hypothetical protein